jgi:hypothetical protein
VNSHSIAMAMTASHQEDSRSPSIVDPPDDGTGEAHQERRQYGKASVERRETERAA